jgi:hypothetical protein
LRLGPQEELGLCNVVPEHRPAAVRPNSGEPAAGIGRAWAGNDQRGPLARFWPKFGVVGAPAGSHGGGDRGYPLYPLLRRRGATVAVTGERRASVGLEEAPGW